MTPRERIWAAHDHQEPDRVPLDFGGHRSSGIMGIAYAKLKKALGITTGDVYIYDMVQQLAIVEEPVLDELNVDTIELGRGFLLEENEWKDWILPDGTACKIPYYVNVEKRGDDWYLLSDTGVDLAVQKQGCLYFEQIHFPMAERDFDREVFTENV